MKPRRVTSKDIKTGNIIQYAAIQSDNAIQPIKDRYFLVTSKDNGKLKLLPITHSYKKTDPFKAFNVKFSDKMQKYLDKLTHNKQTSYFMTAQELYVPTNEIDSANVKLTGDISRWANHELQDIQDKVREKQTDISKRNIAYEQAKEKIPYLQDSKIKYECDHLNWIPTDIFKKMAICVDAFKEPTYPENLHPSHEENAPDP